MRLTSTAVIMMSLLGLLPARADQIIRKGGEWRSVITGLTPEPKTFDICFAPATAEQAVAKLATGKQCSKRDIKFDGNHVIVDIVCTGMSLKGTATMFSDSSYRADFTLGIGSGDSAKVVHTITDAKWTGACKPGEKPQ